MVLQKRSNFGFNGYQIPAMPRGSRSARGRRRGRKNVEENQMDAFELLATVAGNLLLEQENSPGSTPKSPPVKDIVKKEQLDDEKKPCKVEPCDQGSCDEGTLTWKESPQASTSGGPPSAVPVKSDASGRTGFTKESMVQNSAGFRAKKVECPIGSPLQVKRQKAGNGSGGIVSDVFSMEDPMDFDAKPPPLVSSDSSVEVPQYRNHISLSSSLKFKGNMKMLDADEDDDENSSGCSTQPSTITSKTFRSQKIGDRRIKKITASKFWKVGPTLLKDGEFYSNESKSMFRNRKMCCTRQRTQRSSSKRRKLFVRSSMSAGLGVKNGVAFNTKSFEKGTQGDADSSDANLHGADYEIWPSPSLTSQKLSSKSEECKVKLRIKSFKVPELFIEMPETATVGSLKRTVLETVSAMLENGVRVGVILQGKKVKDDSKTLLQAGIADGDKQLDSLGFSLEPNPSKAPQQLSSPEDPLLQQSPESLQPLASIAAITTSESTLVVASSPDDSTGPPATPPDHPRAERDRYSSRPLAVVGPLAPSPPPPPDDRTPPNKALVPVPSADDGGLAMVPLHRKPKRPELVQRRIRRPFSVAEVEALVQAVESLGTGRWRDVKIRAFENAKHRTYVDLKDKWKTLVHTARISPQQRRGEPVPQELLDRVLSAHAHWSHQQAKLQAKPHQQLQATEQSMLL